MQRIANQIHTHLSRARRPILVIHQNPDGDALGAADAMCDYLTKLGKKPQIFCATPVPKKFHFLRHAGSIVNDKTVFQKDIDTILVLDSGDLRHAGVAEHLANHTAQIINIDHHPTNEKYGHINLVLPHASSTSEIIFHYFRYNRIRVTPEMATALLTGIVTDTDSFTNPATTTTSLEAASMLLRGGANIKLINRWTNKNKTLNSLKLWGAVLTRLTKKEGADLVYTFVTQKDLQEFDVSETEVEGIANFLNNLDGAKISLIFKELPDGKMKTSFRTTRDDVDVAAIAKKFGGGGHKKAAGFTADGTVSEVLDRILGIM